MREIKFRGKSAGTWVNGSYVKTGVGLHYIIPQNLIANDLPEYVVDKETVGQYTGLKDKNGKEIYEGDICQREGSLYEVGWQNDFARYGLKVRQSNYVLVDGLIFPMSQYFDDEFRLEVIGNIHENPELLEGE